MLTEHHLDLSSTAITKTNTLLIISHLLISSALKETGSGERAALLSLLSSLREAADKEKDMMELLQVAENSHKKEHDAMLHRLSLSEGEIGQARSSMESSARDCEKAVNDREQLAKELRAIKGEEENLVPHTA